MGLRARIVFCLPATGLTGSGLSEQPTLESRTNCDTPDGHLPDVAEANTIVIALILQEASEDSIAQGLAFVNSKNLLILKKKKQLFYLPHVCFLTHLSTCRGAQTLECYMRNGEASYG